MKYTKTLREIMIGAWAIVKECGVSISDGLKKSWREARMNNVDMVSKLVRTGMREEYILLMQW